jgi:stage II sporulation protein M
MTRLFRHFREMYGYFAVSAALFAVGVWYGLQDPPAFRELIASQIDGLQNAARQISELENEWLGMLLFIFLNNAIKSALIVFLGLMLGIFPVVFLVINGMVIGFMLLIMDDQGLNVADVVLYGLLPHGILELPAIIIACAYGLKLGVLAFRRLTGRDAGELRSTLGITLPLVAFLTVVLFVAALVEATLTPWLMQNHFAIRS